MSKTMQLVKDLREVKTIHAWAESMIRKNLFHRVRLGYAIWHTLAIAKRPLSPTEVFEALEVGNVITGEVFTIKNVERCLKYHTEVGKLKYVAHGHYTIR